MDIFNCNWVNTRWQ